jgi:hypothetical protein
MKLIFLLSLASCAGINEKPSTYYYIKTTKRPGIDSCAPKYESKELMEQSTQIMNEIDQKGFEQHSGYSNCKHSMVADSTYLIECKAPVLYKRLTTTSLAQCDKFMTENKLK